MCAIEQVVARRALRASEAEFRSHVAAIRAAIGMGRAVAWRVANPVLAAGWDDWSRLVREEGWR